jgi:uncharacterized protein YecT (DUF1311 family)
LRANAAALFASHRRLQSNLSAKRRRALLEAPRGWVKISERELQLYSDPEGGTAALSAGRDCFLQATADRAKELRNLTR